MNQSAIEQFIAEIYPNQKDRDYLLAMMGYVFSGLISQS